MEALMLDVELAPENPYSETLSETQLPDAECITPEQRLDAAGSRYFCESLFFMCYSAQYGALCLFIRKE
jgi:hypothetical protein